LGKRQLREGRNKKEPRENVGLKKSRTPYRVAAILCSQEEKPLGIQWKLTTQRSNHLLKVMCRGGVLVKLTDDSLIKHDDEKTLKNQRVK